MNNITSKMQADAFKEMLNIAAARASMALSKLIGRKIQVNAPVMDLIPIHEMPGLAKNPEEIKTIILVKTTGDISACLIVMLSPESTVNLLKILVDQNIEHIEVLNDLEKSALREIGNILTGAAISVLNDMMGTNIIQSVSDVAIDMQGSLFNSLLSEMGKNNDNTLEFDAEFSVENETINGHIYGLFTPESTRTVLKLLENI